MYEKITHFLQGYLVAGNVVQLNELIWSSCQDSNSNNNNNNNNNDTNTNSSSSSSNNIVGEKMLEEETREAVTNLLQIDRL